VTESTIKKQKKNYQFQIPTNIILKKLIEKKNKSMTEGQKKKTKVIIDIFFIKNKKTIFFLSFNFDPFNFNSQQLN
jgi:hypothetical protein